MLSKKSRRRPETGASDLRTRLGSFFQDWNEFWETRPRSLRDAIDQLRSDVLNTCRELGAEVAERKADSTALIRRAKAGELGKGSMVAMRSCSLFWPQRLLLIPASQKRVEDICRALGALEGADLRLRAGEEGLAVMELVAFGRHCQQTFWRRAEPLVERGVRQLERSRAGLARAFGTPKQRLARDKRIKAAWMDIRRSGAPVARCDREVATKSDVSVRTVQRARRRT